MVGLTMALTIALCIVGFIWVFMELEPFVSDFVHRDPSSGQQQEAPEQSANAQQSNQPTEAQPTQEEDQSNQPQAGLPEPTLTPTSAPIPTATSNTFNPDYQVTSAEFINLRSGPGTNNSVVTTVSPQSPLQYLGVEEESQNPGSDGLDPGQSWMKFRTESGEEGWIREIDVGPYTD
jgi:hypothetical protein